MRTNRIRREGSTPHEALIITLGSACRIRTDSSRGAKPLTENDKLLRWHHMCHFIAKRDALTGYSTSKDQGMNGTQSHDGQLLIKLNSIIRITQLFYAIFRCGTHKIPWRRQLLESWACRSIHGRLWRRRRTTKTLPVSTPIAKIK